MKLTDLPRLCEWTQSKTFHPGQTIFLEGDAPHTIYQVVRGVAKLTRLSSGGREIIVGLACPGDFLDVVAILDSRPYGVTAAPVQGNEVEVVAVARERAMAQTALAQFLERTALTELREQRDWTVSLALERVETRALGALTMLARRLGERLGKTMRLRVVLNRQEFAELIGTTTETAIRVLSQFRKQGLVAEDHGWMTLSELACLPA